MPRSVEVPVTVRWRDFDALGHVNNSVFLSYLEIARDQFLRDTLGDTYLDMVIARVELDFRAEIPLGTPEITVTCRALEVGNSSLRTQEQVWLPGGDVAALAVTVGVVRDPKTRSSRPWTPEERAILQYAIG
ncbi:MAG: acyl-CoA thioesterase [bacterium]